MARQITARYRSVCQYQHKLNCEGIKPGETIMHASRGQSWHPRCQAGTVAVADTGAHLEVDDSVGDRDYLQGMMEAQETRWIRNTMARTPPSSTRWNTTTVIKPPAAPGGNPRGCRRARLSS